VSETEDKGGLSHVAASAQSPCDRGSEGTTELEHQILLAWEQHRSSRSADPPDEHLCGLLLKWIQARVRKLNRPIAEVAYDRFVDKILGDLPTRAPGLPALHAYWFHCSRDAKRSVARQRRSSPLGGTCDPPQHEQPILQTDVQALLMRAVGKLAPRAREILSLRGEGLEYATIAAALGISPSSARATCARARALLSSDQVLLRSLPSDCARVIFPVDPAASRLPPAAMRET
jgi:DNA-binding CsgD family transcriptional regulator